MTTLVACSACLLSVVCMTIYNVYMIRRMKKAMERIEFSRSRRAMLDAIMATVRTYR